MQTLKTHFPDAKEDAMTAIALLYIVMTAAVFAGALALLAMWRANHRAATCPETGKGVEVAVDRAQAAKAVFTGDHLKVVDCDRWPGRAGCDRDCENKLHA
jgi:hypothetical protein